MTTYFEFSRDLHELANVLRNHAYDLPLPRYADQPISIEIHTAEAIDVRAAAKALGTKAELRDGYTVCVTDLGSVRVRFVHVSDAAMTRYEKRRKLLKTMSTS